jgi:lipoate-protein ligase A
MKRSAALRYKSKVSYLDVRAASLSALERLLLEECLLRHSPRNWIVVGDHCAGPHQYLHMPTTTDSASKSMNTTNNNKPCIIMGIGGKPRELLHVDKVRAQEMETIKRFSGGGTVVMNRDCIWTTIIGRSNTTTCNGADQKQQEQQQQQQPSSVPLRIEHVPAFPRPIMEWTAAAVFGPFFEQLNQQQHQQQQQQQSKRLHDMPHFQLVQHDYVFAHDDDAPGRKMGGNAQAIVRQGWLHHSSFLWDYNDNDMLVLKLPHKRHEYRGDRNHAEFLLKLKDVYSSLKKEDFYSVLHQTCGNVFDLHEATVDSVMEIVHENGGMQVLYEKSRTRIVDDF